MWTGYFPMGLTFEVTAGWLSCLSHSGHDCEPKGEMWQCYTIPYMNLEVWGMYLLFGYIKLVWTYGQI